MFLPSTRDRRPALSLLLAALGVLAPGLASQNWFTGPTALTFGAPPGTSVRDIALSADERVAFFAADRPGGGGGQLDLWWVTRPEAGAPWSAPSPFPHNSAADDTAPTLDPDGRELFFASDRSGTLRILRSTRAPGSTAWTAPVAVPELDGPGASTGPALTEDGLRMFFAATRRGGGDLFVATRPDRGSPFGVPRPLPVVNDPRARDYDPAPEANGAILWFSSDRRGGAGGADHYVSWFDARTGAWASPVAVTELNGPRDDDGIFVSASSGITYNNSPGLIIVEIDCVCRAGPVGTTLSTADGFCIADASAAWPLPLRFATGATWALGGTSSLSFYDWKVAGAVGVYLPTVSGARLPVPLVPPFVTFGGVEVDPASLITLPPALPNQYGYARTDIALPDLPALRGTVLWTQAFAGTTTGGIEMTLPQRITLR